MPTKRERSLPFTKEYADYRNRLFRLLCQPEFTADIETEVRQLAQEAHQWMTITPSIFQDSINEGVNDEHEMAKTNTPTSAFQMPE